MKPNFNVGITFGNPEEIRSYKEDVSWVLPSTMVGIELELEGVTVIPNIKWPNYWEIKDDGSLRSLSPTTSTLELVLRLPVCGYDLTKALVSLKNILSSKGESYKVSPRCSTHIHIDVRELDFNKLLSMLIIYIILEKPLYHYCGNDRENNNFCLPFYKAEKKIFENLSYSDIEDGDLNKLNTAISFDSRYSGLNLCSLKKFGSLEFRQFPGTMNIDKISQWINIIMCIKKAAIEYNKEIKTIPLSFSENGIEKSVIDIFGEYYKYIKYPQLEYDVLQGVRQAQDVIYKRNIESENIMLSKNISRTNYSYYNELLEKLNLTKNKPNTKHKIKFCGNYPDFLFLLVGHDWPFDATFIIEDITQTNISRHITVKSKILLNKRYWYDLNNNGDLYITE